MKLPITALILLGLTSPVMATQMRAEQITVKHADALIPKGPDASAGVGDWFLSNGTICVTVAALNRESELATTGGALSDVGFCGRADDNIVTFHDLLGDTPIRADRIEAFHGETAAKIVVHGNGPDMITTTTYTLSIDDPTKLKIDKIYRVTGSPDGLPMIPRVWFNYYSLSPYLVDLASPEKSSGSALKAFLGRSPTEIADYAQSADLIIATSATDDIAVTEGGSGKAIAYGWRHLSATRTKADGTVEALPTFALSEIAATAYATFTNGFWIDPDGALGLPQMLQMAIMSPDEGDVINIAEELIIGDRANAAAITDQVYDGAALRGTVSGATKNTVIHFATAAGNPVTYTHPDPSGAFNVRLAPGSYQMIVRREGTDDIIRTIDHSAAPHDIGMIDLAAPAQIGLPQNSGPMRLTILGVDGTPTPDLMDKGLGIKITDQNGLRQRDPMPFVYLTGTSFDPAYLTLRPGTYRILASRGIEYSVEETTITLSQAQRAPLQITPPKRLVDSRGQLGADFHTHAAPSIDSIMATGDRVATFIAEGGEVMVAAEHETIFDYGSVLEATGLGGKVIIVTGTEITSEASSPRNPYTIGHANAFPLTVKENVWRAGQPLNEGRRWRDVIADVKQDWPGALMQLNHPTLGKVIDAQGAGDPQETAGSRGFFLDHMGPVGRQFRADKPLSDPHNSNLIEADPVTGLRDIDFDAVELLNGYWYDSYRAMRAIWVSWLRQGEIVVGVANSDSHNKADLVGWPRNLVTMGAETIEDYDEAAFISAVKGGQLVGTTGPVLTATLNEHGPGTLVTTQNTALRVHVDAADWVEDPSGAYELRISINGLPTHTGKIKAGDMQEIDLTFERDSFVLVEVEGNPSDIYKLIAPKHKPLAFTNPIFVDANGDGKWTPPGF